MYYRTITTAVLLKKKQNSKTFAIKTARVWRATSIIAPQVDKNRYTRTIQVDNWEFTVDKNMSCNTGTF